MPGSDEVEDEVEEVSHDGPADAVCFVEDGALLSGGHDGRVIRWTIGSREGHVALEDRRRPIIDLACAADGRVAVVASEPGAQRGTVLVLSPEGIESARLVAIRDVTRAAFGGGGMALGGDGVLGFLRDGATVPRFSTDFDGEVLGLLSWGERILGYRRPESLGLAAAGEPAGQAFEVHPGEDEPTAAPFPEGTFPFSVEAPRGALARGGALLVVAGGGGEWLRVWDVERRAVAAEVHAGAPIRSVAARGGLVATGMGDGTVLLWSLAALLGEEAARSLLGSGDPADELPPCALARFGSLRLRHAGAVMGLAYLPGGRLLSAGRDGGARLWGEDGRCLLRIAGPEGALGALAVSADGKLAALFSSTPGRAEGVSVHELPSGERVAERRSGPVLRLHPCAAMTAAGDVVAIGGEGAVELWRWRKGESETLPLPKETSATSLAFSPDGRSLAVGLYDGGCILDLVTRRARRLSVGAGLDTQVAYSLDGKTVWTANHDRIAAWDAATGERRATRFPEGAEACEVAVSADGLRIAAGVREPLSFDEDEEEDAGTAPRGGDPVLVWEAASGEVVARIPGDGSFVSSVALHPDGTRVAIGSYDGTIRVAALEAPAPAKPARRKGARAPAAEGEELAIDVECIYSEESYVDLVQQFADASRGAFAPQDVEEEWGDPADLDTPITLRFRVGARRYECELENRGDWADLDFVETINRALADGGEPRRFVEDRGDHGQVAVYRFREPKARKAKAAASRGAKKAKKMVAKKTVVMKTVAKKTVAKKASAKKASRATKTAKKRRS